MTEQEKIENRIRALLAKSRGTESEAEAAAFAAKAQELLARHNLDEADLVRRGMADDVAVIESPVNVKYVDPWRVSVYVAVAEMYFCKIFHHWYVEKGKVRKGITYVGKPHNVAVAQSMAEYLIATTLRLAAAYSKDRALRLGFERGCGERLAGRVRRRTQEAQREAAQAAGHGTVQAALEAAKTSGGTNLPALYASELSLVESHLASLALSKGRKSKGSDLSGRAAADGWRAAEGVSLDAQVAGPSAKLLK